VGKLKERDHFEDIGLDVRIILKRISEKQGRKCGLDASAK
jgi:hypothetical protein